MTEIFSRDCFLVRWFYR